MEFLKLRIHGIRNHILCAANAFDPFKHWIIPGGQATNCERAILRTVQVVTECRWCQLLGMAQQRNLDNIGKCLVFELSARLQEAL